MILTIANQIRDVLRMHPDGLTSLSIARRIGENVSSKSVQRCCQRSMPDTYIDRWQPAKRGQFQAVWVLVEVPPNAPNPRKRT